MNDIPFVLAVEAARMILVAVLVAGALLVAEHLYDKKPPRRR